MPSIRLWFLSMVVSVSPLLHAEESLSTRLMQATFKLTNGRTSATTFVLSRPAGDTMQTVLITAAHTFDQITENEATLVARVSKPNETYEKRPVPVQLRRDGKIQWVRHPTQDVAVLRIALPPEVTLPALPVELLATDEMLKRYEVQPGDILRCAGFPHAGQFEANGAGFPVVRIGCLASFPLLPTRTTKTFLFDFNTFEGDSGAAVYLDDPQRMVAGNATGQRVQMILGLVHAQQFIDERFQTIYQSGQTRHRMGLAIVVHASAIRETLDRLDAMSE